MTDDRAVILDVDGTLVDSNDLHAQAWVDAFCEAGHEVTFETVRPLIGKGGDKLLAEVLDVEESSAHGEALSRRRDEIFQELYLPQVKAFPRTRELVERICQAGYRVAVASSSKREQLDALLMRAGVADLVQTSTSSSDAERSKPDPDIVAAAQEKLGLPASALCMLGDTPYDVKAAQRLGIATIALRCGGWSGPPLAEAIAVYEDPADLLAHFDDSPLGTRGNPHAPGENGTSWFRSS